MIDEIVTIRKRMHKLTFINLNKFFRFMNFMNFQISLFSFAFLLKTVENYSLVIIVETSVTAFHKIERTDFAESTNPKSKE